MPPFLVNKLCARGPVEFHNLVEQVRCDYLSLTIGT